MDRRVFLKVKLKSLAEEARIIKREENKRKVPRAGRKIQRDDHVSRSLTEVAKKARAADSIHRARRRSQSWYPLSAQELHQLHRHRIDVVRREARVTGIAYGIIRGQDPSKVDSMKGLTLACMEKIQKMVKRYGDPEDAEQKELISMSPQESLDALNAAIGELKAA